MSGHKFAGDLDEFDTWSRERIEKKFKNINQDEFSRDKAQEIRCINGKDSIIINPIIEWSDADVWDFLNKVVEVPHCELYDPPYNRHRIGCILCPMSSMKTKLRDIELYPHVKQKWLEVFEYFIGGGYDPDYIKRKSSGFSTRGATYNAYKKNLAEQLFADRSACTQTEQERSILRGGRTRNGKPRWGEAGVSLSAEVLFDWWLTHDSWDEFKAKLDMPTLFDEEKTTIRTPKAEGAPSTLDLEAREDGSEDGVQDH